MAIAPIVIDLLVKGAPQVAQSFKGVQDAAMRAERAMQRDAERAEKQRVAVAKREANAKEQQFARVAREADRWQRQEVRDAERAERQKTREKERALREQERLAERHGRSEARIYAQARREVERIEERSRSKIARDRERDAMAWVRQQERAARDASAARQRFATGMVGAAGRGVIAGAQRAGSMAMGLVSTAAQLGGGFSIADAVAQRGDLQRAAVSLSNSAFIPGQNQRPDVNKIIDRAKAASISTGLDASDLVGATQAYVAKSADFTGGMANMEFFGQIAKGTGTDIGDVAKTAGILRVQNKSLDEASMKQMLLDVIMQGKQGSVEFSDLAGIAGKVTRTSSSYAGTQAENQRKLLGLSQIAIRTSGSPEEAATVLSNISADALKHSGDVGAVVGRDFLNAKGQIAKGPEEFIADVMTKTGGNMQKIQQMGFGMRSMKMFQALAPTFDEAERQAVASGATKERARDAGRKAIVDDMRQVTGASYTEGHLRDDLKAINDSAPERFAQAMRDLKMAVGDELLPVFVNQLVPAIKDATPAFVDLLRNGVPALAELVKSVADFAKKNQWLIETIAQHPIGALIAAEMTKSFAAAALPDLLKRLISGVFPGGGGGGGGGGGTPTPTPNNVSRAAGLVLAGTSMQELGSSVAGGTLAADDLAAKVRAYGRGDTVRGISPEQAALEVQAARGRIDEGPGALGQAKNIIVGGLGGDSEDRAYKQYKADQALVDSKDLQAALKEVAIAMREHANGGNTGANGKGRSEPIISR